MTTFGNGRRGEANQPFINNIVVVEIENVEVRHRVVIQSESAFTFYGVWTVALSTP